jgi:hypothetical protein
VVLQISLIKSPSIAHIDRLESISVSRLQLTIAVIVEAQVEQILEF